ncbi:MAG: hypothetical protein WBB07_07150, partial [Mycobacterium sp.]
MGRHSKPGDNDDVRGDDARDDALGDVPGSDVPGEYSDSSEYNEQDPEHSPGPGFFRPGYPDADDDPDARYRAEPTFSEADPDPLPPLPTGNQPPADENQTAAIRRSQDRPEYQGGHRNDGEWTGSHRTVAPGRRGVSVGVIAALITVVVVVAAVILWRFFGDALSDRSATAAGRCLEGELTVAVLADPAIAGQLETFAEKFNGSASPVGDHCIAVAVKAADSDAVISGFSGEWPTDLGDKPALWIPGSSVSTARLQAAANPSMVTAANSLVTSPVMLAIRPELSPALADQSWRTLPGLQSNPNALDDLNLPGWGSLRLALPTAGDSDAGYLAAEAIAAASAPN